LDLLKIVLVWEHLLRPLDRTVALVRLVLQAAGRGAPRFAHFRAVRIGKEEEADLTFSNCQIGGKAHWHGDKTRPQPTEGLAGAASNLARGRAERSGLFFVCFLESTFTDQSNPTAQLA
jgi:hypothetical protein